MYVGFSESQRLSHIQVWVKCFYKVELGFCYFVFQFPLYIWRSEVGSFLSKCVSYIPRSDRQALPQVLLPTEAFCPFSPVLIESFYLECILKSKIFYKSWEHIHLQYLTIQSGFPTVHIKPVVLIETNYLSEKHFFPSQTSVEERGFSES